VLTGARAVMRPAHFDTVVEFVGFDEREELTLANLPASFWPMANDARRRRQSNFAALDLASHRRRQREDTQHDA
jgi:hypothetical protein